MSIDAVNSFKSVHVAQKQVEKPTFGKGVPKNQEAEDESGLIVAGLVAAAAIGAAAVMIVKGKGSKVVKETTQAGSNKPANVVQEVVNSAASKKSEETQALSTRVKIEDFAKKYRIKNYVTPKDLSIINGVAYKDGKPYTGKCINLNSWASDVFRYKNGKVEFKATELGSPDYILEREVGGVHLYRSSNYRGSYKLADKMPEEKYLKATSIGELPQHSYKDIPDIGVVTRGYSNDYTFYRTASNAVNYRILSKKGFYSVGDEGKIILGVGKTDEGKAFVFFQSPADRYDNVNRPIRNMITLTAPEGKINEAQLDLIKAVVGKDFKELSEQKPLARAFSVNYSEIDESINIDENMLLNEIAHFSKGRELDSTIQKKLSELENMRNGDFMRLWSVDRT